ncbi:MAG: sigma-54-dependent Fis family transcriptional regulator, partial [Candidatus Eisenbacteria bacterium]|nr:sigma-54-dependent Fis family transcriptional regulator [Candidatus Latescibacterota bacterium]MBD3301603.1 sigma-54-dependent Fis family transcriptional regulator [Candidatus Eisenbacteria bacterium]
EGPFRQDLYFRLVVAPITLPPLRERPEDIPLVAEFLLRKLSDRLGKRPAPRLTETAMKKLAGHSWPGNVRELENVLTRAVAMLRGEVIDAERLEITPPPAEGEPAEFTGGIVPLREMEARYVAHVLRRMDWNITRSAEALSISPTTLRKKITDYGLRGSDSPEG